jgi:hypothetical protein
MIRDLPKVNPTRAWSLPAPDKARSTEHGRYVKVEAKQCID